MQDLVHWLHATGGSSLASLALPGVATRNCGGLGTGHRAPGTGHWARSSHRQQRCGPGRPVRQKRKQKRICMARLHPASTKLRQMSRRTSCLLPDLWQEEQGGEAEGERGGSSKHGYYTCKSSTGCSCSAFPLSTPCILPSQQTGRCLFGVLRTVGEEGGGCCLTLLRVRQRWLHPCACPAGPAGPPGCVRAEPLPTPARPAGWELRGSPEATHGVWDGEQSRCFTSPPAPQTSSLEYLAAFQGSFPWGQAKQKLP